MEEINKKALFQFSSKFVLSIMLAYNVRLLTAAAALAALLMIKDMVFTNYAPPSH